MTDKSMAVFVSTQSKSLLVNKMKEHGITIVRNVESADVVVFPQSPTPWMGWAGDKVGVGIQNAPIIRNLIEVSIYNKALRFGVPCVGLGNNGVLLAMLNGLTAVPCAKATPFNATCSFDKLRFWATADKCDYVFDNIAEEVTCDNGDNPVVTLTSMYGAENAFFQNTRTISILPNMFYCENGIKVLMRTIKEMEHV